MRDDGVTVSGQMGVAGGVVFLRHQGAWQRDHHGKQTGRGGRPLNGSDETRSLLVHLPPFIYA